MNEYDKDMMHYRMQIAGDKEQIHKIDMKKKKSFEQKIDGDMGSFDVMSEPVKMSVSANKVNRHSAGRSNFMQAKEEKKPEEFKVDQAATNAANMVITKENQAIAAENAASKAEARRINDYAALEFSKDKSEIEAANKAIDAANKREKARIQIENKKGAVVRQQNPQLSKRKRKIAEKKAKKKTSQKKNPFSGL